MFTKVKTDIEIVNIRIAAQALGSVLEDLKTMIRPGITTWDIARQAEKHANKLGVELAFKGYQGFPDVICISVNDEIVHGIPRDDHVIPEGALVGLDFGTRYKGMIADAAITVGVGAVSGQDKRLLQVTEAALQAGISQVRAGAMTGDIGYAIEKYIKSQGNYGIVRDLVGHGVGHELHESPDIPNYGKAGSGYELKAGMTIAIEPMVTLGSEQIGVLEDGWTIVTQDGSKGAQFEHTILVTDDGFEILSIA